MATILQRASLIIKSNINDLLNKFENPEKIIDQCIIEAKTEYAKTLDKVSEVKGKLDIQKAELDKLKKSCLEWQATAEKAVLAGNDEDAKYALGKAAEEKTRIGTMEATVSLQQEHSDEAIAALNDLSESIKGMEAKKNELKAKSVTTESKKLVNEIKSNKGVSSLNKFDEMAEKIDVQLAKENAKSELINKSVNKDAEIKAKYAAPNVDADLEALKKQLGV